MNVGQLKAILELLPDHMVVPVGIGPPHSWRGIYSEVAFEPVPNVSVWTMRRFVGEATRTYPPFEARKGGDYLYDDGSLVNLAELFVYREDAKEQLMALVVDWLLQFLEADYGNWPKEETTFQVVTP